MSLPLLLMGAGGFAALGVDFDGSTAYLSRGADFTGIADGKKGTISFWFRLDGGDGSVQAFISNTGSSSNLFSVYRAANNRIEVWGVGAGTYLHLVSGTSFTQSTTWHHLAASWDTANSLSHLYIDGVSNIDTTTIADGNIDYTNADFFVGARTDAGQKLNGCLSEFYFNSADYLDISVGSNLEKFRANSKPVNLGIAGNRPTGNTPILYLKTKSSANAFATNKGSGGNLTVNGTLVLSSTNP